MKILIVEDNALTRSMMQALLKRLKHDVVGEAADGEAAIKAFTDLRPEAVFLDIILPRKSGMEVLCSIKKLDPAVKIVVVTAVIQKDLDKKLLDRGADAIIHKPFSFEEFNDVLARLT